MNTKSSLIDKDNPPAYPKGVNWNVDIPNMTLNEMVETAINQYGDKKAIDFLGKKTTFNELNDLIDRAAKGFQALGVEKGDRVGVFMPNSTYHFIMFFGALKAGAVLVPFLSTYNDEQVLEQIKDSGTKVMVTMDLETVKPNPTSGKLETTSFYPSIERLLKNGELPEDFKIVNCRMQDILPFPKNILYPLAKKQQVMTVDRSIPTINANVVDYANFMRNDGDYQPVKVSHNDLALLQYTNGTSSGKPKGVQLTHGNITANVIQTEEYMVASEGKENVDGYVKRGEEKILGILPYFHVYGMNVLMMFSMRTGSEVLILPDPKDLKQIVSTIKKEKPSLAPFVPKHYMAFAEKLSMDELKHFARVKTFMSGSEKLKPSVREAFESAAGAAAAEAAKPHGFLGKLKHTILTHLGKAPEFPSAESLRPRILEGYGASEGAPVFTAETPAKIGAPGSVGYPLPGIEMKIIPECPPDEIPQNWDPVARGVKGEICVRGKNITQGYLNRPDATRLALHKEFENADAWYRTGDLGILDEEGRLTITGRSKDIIIINGENVACAAVEEHVLNFPGIAECNVVEVQDARSGEAAVVFIRFKPGQTPADGSSLRAFLKEQNVPALETPKHIVFWPEDKELPTIGVGKPDKNALRKLAAEKFGPKNNGPEPGAPTINP